MLRKTYGLLTLAFVAAACGDGTGPADAIDVALDEDVATVAADAAVEDVQQMIVTAGSPAQMASSSGARPVIEIARSVTFYDAQGVEQIIFDPMLTASIDIMVELSGETQRDSWTGSLARIRDLTVSGLEGDETSRTWNGTGSGLITGSRHTDSEGTRTYELASSSVVSDVVVALPRIDNLYPQSGIITRNITATFTNGDRTETRSRTASIEFNGTQFAVLTVGDHIYEVDLAARDGERAHRRR